MNIDTLYYKIMYVCNLPNCRFNTENKSKLRKHLIKFHKAEIDIKEVNPYNSKRFY